MTSLETNEYLIPSVPIEIPSDIVMVLKRTDFRPASSTESHIVLANSLICILHGVTLDQVDAIPTCGFLKSSSVKPVGLSIDLAPACSTPSTKEDEYFLFLLIFNYMQR